MSANAPVILFYWKVYPTAFNEPSANLLTLLICFLWTHIRFHDHMICSMNPWKVTPDTRVFYIICWNRSRCHKIFTELKLFFKILRKIHWTQAKVHDLSKYYLNWGYVSWFHKNFSKLKLFFIISENIHSTQAIFHDLSQYSLKSGYILNSPIIFSTQDLFHDLAKYFPYS